MYLNKVTCVLHSDSGQEIKKIDCPRSLKLADLQEIAGGLDRYCSMCKSDVVNIQGMKDDDVVELVNKNPDVCVFSSGIESRTDVVSHTYGFDSIKKDYTVRAIKTVRGAAEVNALSEAGVRMLIRSVTYSPEIRQKAQVWRNKLTGNLRLNNDYRESVEDAGDDWEVIIPWFFYRSEFPRGPIAAYLIPHDIKVGERVHIEDLIEDVPCQINEAQEDAERLESACAVWNGCEFNLEVSDSDYILG